ncbi:hypothetical protein IHQ71_31315 (plasmid) [Rhizobium sp. TH2]|uniref:hypothetical protein n=1 Tax=Rhizobium sp. TH2 TaxID=2775403 RepID=UPI002157EE23|nr:hypothetical protein [Rhizobium sp. TH2]UVC12656.1 hypothetical protein IHQ71_31315 [Rhizobium sp. TH2]
MSFTFDHLEMGQDLQSLGNAASRFLLSRTQNLDRLRIDLGFAVEAAKRGGPQTFEWETASGSPIVLRKSRNWKGANRDADELYAEMTVDYTCAWDSEKGRVRVKEGVTCVAIRNSEEVHKSFHFDTCEGGWNNSAAHPPFHMQVHGSVNDIPRLPSIIVHPVDVLNFAILELHQSDWREHADTNDGRQKLRHLPARQRNRLIKIADGWITSLRNGGGRSHPLVLLQTRSPMALDL